jgi:hypothetical protein
MKNTTYKIRTKTCGIYLPMIMMTQLAIAGAVIEPGDMEAYATPIAIGLEIPYAGDDNKNANAQFVWRKQGSEDWKNGVDMTIDRERRMIWASIWPLEQGDKVEIKVEFIDADGAAEALNTTATVRTIPMDGNSGKKLFVSPKGNDGSGDGTRENPFRSVGRAAEDTFPGDEIRLLGGNYAEGIELQGLKGKKKAPIVIAPAEGEKVTVHTVREVAAGSGSWKQHSGDTYTISAELPVGWIGSCFQENKLMFPCSSVGQLAQFKRSWYHDKASKTLYVRTGDGTSADEHTYQIPQRKYAIWLDRCKYVTIKGLDVAYGSDACIRLSGSTKRCAIIDNVLHESHCGVFAKGSDVQGNAIWRNDIRNSGAEEYGWQPVYDKAGFGIIVQAGRGNSVCYNTVDGFFDQIGADTWRNFNNIAENRDMDVCFNVFLNANDDALEMDGGGVNMRIHGNQIRNAHSAISLAPIHRGPVYVTRNEGTYQYGFFKLNVGGKSSLGPCYAYHNSGYTLMSGATGTGLRFPGRSVPTTQKVFLNNATINTEYSMHNLHPGNTLDYNCYASGPGMPPRKFTTVDGKIFRELAEFVAATGQETHGLYTDPEFSRVTGLAKYTYKAGYSLDSVPMHTKEGLRKSDFSLDEESPCVDKGVIIRGINEDFKGKAPDIGAREFDDYDE